MVLSAKDGTESPQLLEIKDSGHIMLISANSVLKGTTLKEPQFRFKPNGPVVNYGNRKDGTECKRWH